MNTESPARTGRRRRGKNPRYRSVNNRDRRTDSGSHSSRTSEKQGLLAGILAFFGIGKSKKKTVSQPLPSPNALRGVKPSFQRKPELVEVTSSRLYVGNLSYDATESDLFELFNGVGSVQSVEVVSHKHTQRSKGFAFVQMQSLEEAKRAVEMLHDRDYMGRKLVVSGAKAPGSRDD